VPWLLRKGAEVAAVTGGERRTERRLSAHTTCRHQRRSLHAYIVELLAAHARGDPAPLLS